ncbi:MAG: PDDEXK nuclease domain-containing protein [Anaerostipes sp.]|uniref:PDDEXK nuclease domain-containing protein n=1 Tax=Enterocloster bolteae TaxID=208479 RepID=UPI00210A1212|nr:PDDEXK nuclease domain-containing protein [Enterocloster bolteae]MCQ4756933.1 PDDEXK nuclease domain-containing protein [Enterocloster bolteae]MDD4370719.1 PDDEXK nuclease domain-containing protein [Anaerostipes sp.]
MSDNELESNMQMDESNLFKHIAVIIENRKESIASRANCEVTLMYWEVGHYINTTILEGDRAKYGKKIIAKLAEQLQTKYGNSFDYANIRRMIQLAERFPDFEILVPLARELSWSHFIALLPIKSDDAFMYYANDAICRKLGKRELRNQISRKSYERREIANMELSEQTAVPLHLFKDPYLLDTLGLKDDFLEADLEKAILVELEKFFLEFGHGFSFVERQKRMTMDGDDFRLDLLFYHRDLKRLVAVELKIGKFKPQYKGQMEFYLRWLNQYERREGEDAPIGLILCTEASRDQIELMEMDKAGIAVAQYWTALPPKAEFERKIKEIYAETQERLERRKELGIDSSSTREIDYFLERDKEEEDE